MRITCIWAHGLLVCGVLGLIAASVVPMAHATPKRAERKSPPAAERVEESLPATPSPSAPPKPKPSAPPKPKPSAPPKPKPSVAHAAPPERRLASAERVGVSADWTLNHLPSEAIEVVGVAPYPARAESRAHARMQARQAAILDAQQQLVEQLYGVQVTATRRKSNQRIDEDIAAHTEGVLQGARIVAERDRGDLYEVRMRWTPPSGAGALPQPERQPALPKPTPVGTPPTRHAPRIPMGYTGVVIDARGLGLQPSMSPRLRDSYGNTLWGDLEIAPETVIEYGLASWARTHAELNHPNLRARIGDNPLWIRAIRVQGVGRNEVILDSADAERLLRENAVGGFLERLAVVFLY
jgi:hypothetical protein